MEGLSGSMGAARRCILCNYRLYGCSLQICAVHLSFYGCSLQICAVYLSFYRWRMQGCAANLCSPRMGRMQVARFSLWIHHARELEFSKHLDHAKLPSKPHYLKWENGKMLQVPRYIEVKIIDLHGAGGQTV